MIEYTIGIALLLNGAIYLKRELTTFDSKYHHLILLIGNLGFLLSFAFGFFYINWYAPIVGAIFIGTLIGFVQYKINLFMKGDSPLKRSFLIFVLLGFRNQLLIIIGLIMSVHSLLK